ncbi:hypothetical protein EXS74_01450 [Candidatus Woesearchaeota archaeon]|nr:hypothetical protein [Candidatus Woesearchaeota archaeon]
MKKLFTLFLLLILAGCSAPQVELQEVTKESVITEIPDVVEEVMVEEPIEEDTPPYYYFFEGESKEILGSTITLLEVNSGPEVELTINGEDATIKNTKNEEIIGDLKVVIDSVTYSYNEENIQERSAILKVEELDLGNNEYIIRKGDITTVGSKDIILEESRGSNVIIVTVNDKGRISGYTEEIKRGESIYIYGITVTNLKNYYNDEQYAWVIIE